MTNTQRKNLEADVRTILCQGGNPVLYRDGLACVRGVSLEVVDAAIAAVGGSPRVVDAEEVAQERLAEERQVSRTHRAAYREYQHEEE